MKRLDWLIEAFKNGAHHKKSWINSIFAVIKSENSIKQMRKSSLSTGKQDIGLFIKGLSKFSNKKVTELLDEDFDLIKVVSDDYDVFKRDAFRISYLDDKVIYRDAKGDEVEIEDNQGSLKKGIGAFHYWEPIKVTASDIPTIKDNETKVVSIGCLLINYLMYSVFGDNYTFMDGPHSLFDVEKWIAPRIKEDDEAKEGDVSISQYYRYTVVSGLIAGLADLCTATMSEKGLSTHPDMIKKRNELVEKYKDNINDPMVVYKITEELKKLDKEYFKGDDTEEYMSISKYRNISRVKSKMLIGYMDPFVKEGLKPRTVPYGISEGLKLEDMDLFVSDSRQTSGDRGSNTALSGYEVKNIITVTQDVKITIDDCKSKVFIRCVPKAHNKNLYISHFMREGNGLKEITTDNINSLVNKEIWIRSSATCKEKNGNICKTCAGTVYAKYPNAIPTSASNVPSTLMMKFMKAMHGGALSTCKLDIPNALV